MGSLKDKFRRFMVGRYGMDELNRFLAALTLIFVIVHLFVRSPVFFWLELASIILVYMRMFSRNTGKRFHENQKYLRFAFYAREYVGNLRFKLKEKGRYKIFKCPDCGQKIRIPRGHGKIEIHCRSCGHNFMGKS